MENQSSPSQSSHESPEASSQAPQAGPESDAAEKRIPIADGGYGPLDSDDIEWLIESGSVWMP